MSHQEDMQILRYGPGQKYGAHMDVLQVRNTIGGVCREVLLCLVCLSMQVVSVARSFYIIVFTLTAAVLCCLLPLLLYPTAPLQP